MADFAADSRAPRHNFLCVQSPPPIRFHQDRHGAIGPAGRAEPRFAESPRLQSFPGPLGRETDSLNGRHVYTRQVMFAVKTIRPSSGSTTPGMAIPIAMMSLAAMAFALSSFSIVRSTAATACSGPTFRGVARVRGQ